ncbi:MAG: Signal peptidase I [Archaeoglobus fulgidus]|jgi:signal peptidase I|uniref:Signal peptidase I n=1 Tax=Archaeoglobus fulgidus TaxID=2234 RepID=A0A117KV77_ARCFL|nr:MAG: Signal peptidase I [Archaeoglobus fulgidus]
MMKKFAILCIFILTYSAFVALADSFEEFPVLIGRAGGTSMYPAIHDGDLVLVWKGAEFKVGDVVVFKGLDNLVAHRVIGIYADGRVVETKGDNVDRSDGYCWRDEIIGKVVLVGPWWLIFVPHATVIFLGVVWRDRLLDS